MVTSDGEASVRDPPSLITTGKMTFLSIGRTYFIRLTVCSTDQDEGWGQPNLKFLQESLR